MIGLHEKIKSGSYDVSAVMDSLKAKEAKGELTDLDRNLMKGFLPKPKRVTLTTEENEF